MARVYQFRPLIESDVQGLEVGQILINRLKQPLVVILVDGGSILVAQGTDRCGFAHEYVQHHRQSILDRACTVYARQNGIETTWVTGREVSFPHEWKPR